MPSDLALLTRTRLVAIVRLEHYERALEVAQALLAGGISVIEFTLTGRGATEAIASTRAALGDAALIGAGTVLKPGDVTDVVSAGAQFVVTPVLRHSVIEACLTRNIPIICGALTPTEIVEADEAGAALVKVFPARQVGPQYLRDLLAPLPHLRLVPTGGVTLQNASAYLQAGAVAVGVGGNLISEQAVAAREWAQITRQAQEYVQAIQTAQN
ncbi:MAG TPA: bifunctional 4-hydroxy-2-oxoglutarate aldolase/2-dehydro-3-deoxy-phosphogluconate aldolase [Ktedonobacterales bacterium]|jgi:2-dehydro-3-deoxyphosphogluconate aldolase/(4S)-4-hydroxy-2-oxoglutarate aldolase